MAGGRRLVTPWGLWLWRWYSRVREPIRFQDPRQYDRQRRYEEDKVPWYLELLRKRRPVQTQTSVGQVKRPKIVDLWSRGQKGHGRCANGGKYHEGSCRENVRSCFRCGQTSNFRRDWIRGALICFHYNQTGYKKVDCPILTGAAMVAPAPTSLRITDIN